MKQTYEIGKTKVNVFQKDERGQTNVIQRGIVVGETNAFLRVYNPDPVEKGGDVTPQAAQWFAKDAPRSYCQLAGELKMPIKLPADM